MCYPLEVVDLVDEMDKKINPLPGEVHLVHKVHLVHEISRKPSVSTDEFRVSRFSGALIPEFASLLV